jgi:hypothetical protein
LSDSGVKTRNPGKGFILDILTKKREIERGREGQHSTKKREEKERGGEKRRGESREGRGLTSLHSWKSISSWLGKSKRLVR